MFGTAGVQASKQVLNNMSRKMAKPLADTSSSITSTGQAIQELPEELVRRILLHLTCRDVCRAVNSSKAFCQWASSLSLVTASWWRPRDQVMASLRLFMERRIATMESHHGLKVRGLFFQNGSLAAPGSLWCPCDHQCVVSL